MANELMNPCAMFEERPSPLSPRPPALGPDTTVGLFANDKKNADVLLQNVESLLRDRHAVTSFRWFRKEASSPRPVHRGVHRAVRRRRGRDRGLRLVHVVVYP